METKYIYGAVALLVILVILFLIMRKRGSDSSTPTDDKRDTVGPTIEVGNLQATQNPDKSDNTTDNTKTSSYMIKKTEGYDSSGDTFDDTELSKNIQLGLTWSNGGGWDEIDTIKVKWEQKVTDSDDNTKTINKVRMTKEINKSTANANYFSQYMSGLTHTFTANDGLTGDSKFSAVGENMIHVYYIDKDGNEVRLTGDDVQTYVVTVDMLSATKDLIQAKTYIYKPTTGTATISATITDNEYYLYSVGINKDMIKHISNNAKSGKIVILPEGESATNSVVRLKVKLDNDTSDDKYFLKRATTSGADGKIEIAKNNTTTFDESYKFATVKGSGSGDDANKYIRFRQTGSDNTANFMMVDFKDNKKLKIKSYTGIDDLCTNNSLDFILSATVLPYVQSRFSENSDDCVNAQTTN